MWIHADTVFECCKEIPFTNLIHGLYLFPHGTQIFHVESLCYFPKRTAPGLLEIL